MAGSEEVGVRPAKVTVSTGQAEIGGAQSGVKTRRGKKCFKPHAGSPLISQVG